ncbi:MAG: ACP S-malonyltransferase [Polyangia bacterium]
MKAAFVFPGQGAQKVGMGRDLFEGSAAARFVFERADAALGESFCKLLFEGPQDELTLTANAQPAILTVSIAALEALREKTDEQPALVAGHSLGEFSALVCAGALSFEDAVRTTRARGNFMQDAVPPGEGAMAAVMKAEPDAVESACERAAEGEVVAPANFNSPGQIVISGHAPAVGRASKLLEADGARVIPLRVSAPFHSQLMAPAAERLDAFLAELDIKEPRAPVVANVSAEPNSQAGAIRELLVRQVTSPVRWTESVRNMIAAGIDRFVELGPGTVLAGLIKKIDRNQQVISAGDGEGIEKAASFLEGS